jgi:hypothetical protein
VWTSLPPKFNDLKDVITVDQAVAYLKSLTGAARDISEQYVRNTPRQIDTIFRRRIEAELGWRFDE